MIKLLLINNFFNSSIVNSRNEKSPPQKNINAILKLFSSDLFSEALDSIDKLLTDYSHEELIFNIQGACFAGLGQLDNAIKSYEHAISIKPDSAKAHYNLAGAFQEVNQLENAVKSYERALTIEPKYAEAFNNLGNVFRELNQVEDAVRSYENALIINPKYIEAYFSLGVSNQDLGQFEAAVKSYEKALQIKPDFIDALNNLGITLKNLGKFDEAIKNYEKAIEIKPIFVEAHNNLGVLLMDLKQMDESIKCFEQALAIDFDNAEVHNNLGNVLKRLEQLDASSDCYERAIAIKPDYAEAHNNLGITLMDLGKVEEAVKSYERAVEFQPNYAEAYYHLGIAYQRSSNESMSIKSFEMALNIQPNYLEAQHMLNSLSGYTSKEPPRQYVEKLFDDYAEKFDESLVEELGYRLPFFLKDIIHELGLANTKFEKVIDLGCGTGLSGNELINFSKSLTGVDLSQNMISKARDRGVYDNLIIGDIVHTLKSAREKYDLFVALDVLIYIGDIVDITNAIKDCCTEHSFLILSIESQKDGGYSLLKTGRYSHSLEYVLNITSDNFQLIKVKEVNLRKENGKWIAGQIIILQAL